MARRLSILGATGSVGAHALDLVAHHEGAFELVALTAGQNGAKLAELARQFRPEYVALADPSEADALADCGVPYESGSEAICTAAAMPADIIICGIVGFAGLAPSCAALQKGVRLGLANKEALVSAGGYFMQRAAQAGAHIYPIDSEHNGVFQILGDKSDDVARIVLTASGGPFYDLPREEFASVTPQMAVQHPIWSMGAKISVDSASMMNKGLELIEAAHLFGVSAKQLDVVVHRQSLVHALVQFTDGALMAHLGMPDMRAPIAACLFWPERRHSGLAPLDLADVGRLDFAAPDRTKFPCLALAEAALAAGDGATNALNAANEVAVAAFLAGRLGFDMIAPLVDKVLRAALAAPDRFALDRFDGILACDAHYRAQAEELLIGFAPK